MVASRLEVARRRPRSATIAAAGGAALLVALWLPWFNRGLSSVFAPVRAHQTLSGWRALGGLGGLVLAFALVALAWAAMVRRRPSAVWLVLAGGLALMVVMAVTVDRVGIGAQDSACCEPVVTTTASAGLAVAYAGALAIILVGLAVLVQEARRRSREG